MVLWLFMILYYNYSELDFISQLTIRGPHIVGCCEFWTPMLEYAGLRSKSDLQ